MIDEDVTTRWRDIDVPNTLTADFVPFGRGENLIDWRGMRVTDRDLVLDAAGIDLSSALFDNVTFSKFRLSSSHIRSSIISDCQMIEAEFDDCDLASTRFTDVTLSFAKLSGCTIEDVSIIGGTTERVVFQSSAVSAKWTLGVTATKMTFTDSDVKLTFITPVIGIMRFQRSRGIAMFATNSVPKRLMSKLSSVQFFAIDSAGSLLPVEPETK